MADWFGLQLLLPLLLLLSVLLVVLVPGVRSYFLSCTRRRRSKRKNPTEADPGEICSSTPLGRVTRTSRYDLEKLFIPSLESLERLDNSRHTVDLNSEESYQDLQDQCQYTLGDETLHNLFYQLPDVSRSFLVEETEEGSEVLEKCIQDETISDSMVNITFVC